ncbi:hypothetical protein DPMN_126166 [Dreissena polymorpha]|uniref:Uncharacterized protein n=1 Tax=Dreissena polymorpha TaxID=45954 RepID=A0A9D4JU77_DREPO|nr:hypothetical protein DPMN_126166 [Dreissena polymorpha]
MRLAHEIFGSRYVLSLNIVVVVPLKDWPPPLPVNDGEPGEVRIGYEGRDVLFNLQQVAAQVAKLIL